MENEHKKKNKGEWSEVYAFAKLLKDGKIFSADENANPIINCFSRILEVYRDDKGFIPNGKYVIVLKNEEKIADFPMEELDKLLPEIKRTIEVAKTSPFENRYAEKLLEEINSYNRFHDSLKKIQHISITANNSNKADIYLRIANLNVSESAKLGFSIKSYLGGPPTLFNCSHASKFTFRIVSISNDCFSLLSDSSANYSKVKEFINDNKIDFIFDSLKDLEFRRNLMMIDSFMPQILGEGLKYFYLKKGVSLIDICNELERNDFLKVNKIGFYKKKIVDFLVASALGMTAAKPWDGKEQANGGFIIVKKTGDLVCYHIYDRDAFRDYLLKHVKMDTPDSKKYLNKGELIPDGRLYREDGNIKMNLNLQIRFCKEG